MVGPARPLFVLFGSSIVQYSFSNDGWGSALADIYARKADILVRGYAAWNSRRALEVIDKVFPKDDAVQPNLVIVYFGGNDLMGGHESGLGPHVPLEEYVENMRTIINHIKNLSEKTQVIVLTNPPVNEKQIEETFSSFFYKLVRTNIACQKYAEALMALCVEMDVKAINLFEAITRKDDWKDKCFTDGIHFNSEGSKILVEEILKVLREADWKPSLHWKNLPTEFSDDSPYDNIGSNGKTTVNVSNWTFHRNIQWN